MTCLSLAGVFVAAGRAAGRFCPVVSIKIA